MTLAGRRTAEPGGGLPQGHLVRARAASVVAIVAVNLVVPAALLVAGLPRPWKAFYGEESPINWFSSVQCVVVGVLAFAVWLVSRAGRSAGVDPARRSWPWLMLAAGFVGLGADEQFELHERLREGFFRPRGLFTDLPWLNPGDVVLPLYALAGVLLLVALFADLRRERPALVLFVCALALIAVLAVQDSLSLRILRSPSVRPVQIVVEEIGETASQALFALSLVHVLFARLVALAGAARGRV